MTRLLSAFLIGIFFATMSSAQDVVGTYRLIAFAVDYDDGTSVDFFGKNPNGYLIIIPKRLVAILAAENRKFGTSVDEKAALLNSLTSISTIGKALV